MYVVFCGDKPPTRHRMARAAMKVQRAFTRSCMAKIPTRVEWCGNVLDTNHFAALCRREKYGVADEALRRHEKYSGLIIPA